MNKPLAATLTGTIALAAALALAQGQGPNPATGVLLTPSAVRFTPDLVSRLKAPPGFQVKVFAQNVGNVRIMEVMPNGDLYVSRRQQGDVILLRDRDRDGAADGPPTVVASNIKLAHGLESRGNKLYIAADTYVWVADIRANGSLGQPRAIIDDLPDSGQHSARTLAFGPDGNLYINVGSACNDCTDPNPERATILRARPDGSAREVYARGLRHTIGFDWHPATRQLWGMDQGSDRRGDDTPPEELNLIVRNENYGFPYCYANGKPDFDTLMNPPGTTKEAFCPTTAFPKLTATAHSAPIGFQFYTGSQFPAEYRNDAIVAFRGSWNRSQPSGYKVVRVRYDNRGQPQAVTDFVTGWLIPPPANLTSPGDSGSVLERNEASRPAQFGRVAGVAQWVDGSVLIAEDENGVIYRVVYTGGR